MHTDQRQQPLDVDATLARLRDFPHSTTWQDRLGFARALEGVLERHGPTESAMKLVCLLADDTKWEVRKTVADLLLLVPEEDLLELSAKLAADHNAFVCNAANRVLKEWKQKKRKAKRERRDFNRALSELARIEKQHGKEAAEQARRAADQMYQLTLGAIAHDMRGVLTRLKGRTAMLQGHVDAMLYDPAVFRKALHSIADRLEFTERLVDDMQAYSLQLKLNCRRERLSDIINEACNMARDRVRCGGHDPDQVLLAVRVPPSITLDASRHVIVTALANVISNAYDALLLSPSRMGNGKIDVHGRIFGPWIGIVVKDNGMGMCEDHLRKVREFIPGKTTKKGLGTGFGLPIARRNIKAHNGAIDIDSIPGLGTTVTIAISRDHKPPRHTTTKE